MHRQYAAADGTWKELSKITATEIDALLNYKTIRRMGNEGCRESYRRSSNPILLQLLLKLRHFLLLIR